MARKLTLDEQIFWLGSIINDTRTEILGGMALRRKMPYPEELDSIADSLLRLREVTKPKITTPIKRPSRGKK